MPRIRWTPEEDERLLDLNAAGKSWTLISGMLKRSMKSVKLHAKTLRLVGAKKAGLPEEWAEGQEEIAVRLRGWIRAMRRRRRRLPLRDRLRRRLIRVELKAKGE